MIIFLMLKQMLEPWVVVGEMDKVGSGKTILEDKIIREEISIFVYQASTNFIREEKKKTSKTWKLYLVMNIPTYSNPLAWSDALLWMRIIPEK